MVDDVESQPQPIPNGKEMHDNNRSGLSMQDNNEEEEANKFTLYNYLQHSSTFIDRSYRKDSLRGF